MCYIKGVSLHICATSDLHRPESAMPRVSPNQKGVAFSAKVPPELYREFTRLFPIYGATTWFINESLKAFLAQVREDGTLQQDVINSIDRMVTERRELDEVTHD